MAKSVKQPWSLRIPPLTDYWRRRAWWLVGVWMGVYPELTAPAPPLPLGPGRGRARPRPRSGQVTRRSGGSPRAPLLLYHSWEAKTLQPSQGHCPRLAFTPPGPALQERAPSCGTPRAPCDPSALQDPHPPCLRPLPGLCPHSGSCQNTPSGRPGPDGERGVWGAESRPGAVQPPTRRHPRQPPAPHRGASCQVQPGLWVSCWRPRQNT